MTAVRSVPLRRFLSGFIIVSCLVAGACSSASEENSEEQSNDEQGGEQLSTDTGEDSGEPDWTGAQLNPYDLRVGQCFSDWSWFDEGFDRRINITAAVDCSEPHKKEVFHEAEFPAPNGAPFPGETKMTEWSTDLCYGAFADFVGVDYELSVYEIDFIQPTQATFEHPVGRHRRVTCVLYHLDGADLEGSARQTAV